MQSSIQERNPALQDQNRADQRIQFRHFMGYPFHLAMDFTGTEYDTKAECIEPAGPGLRFSDNDTPFPTVLRYDVDGTWTHVAATGWQPENAASVDQNGPALLIPLMQPGQWELEVVLDYSAPAGVSDYGYCHVGYITSTNHVGACATMYDANAAATEIIASLETNDGDDTFTARYTGVALAGAGVRTYRFRTENGCIRVYDDQDDAWHDWEDRPAQISSVNIPYTAAWAFVQFSWAPATTFWTIYLQSLKITYVV